MRIASSAWLMSMLAPLVSATAWAYVPGPEIIRECPKCAAPVKQSTMASGNTLGARFWTDGKMEAPMLPDRPRLVKCPKCGQLFWIDEAKEIGRRTVREIVSNNDKWKDAQEPVIPSEADLLAVLSPKNLPKEKEIYVRRHAWWAANDGIRSNPGAESAPSPVQEKNLQALVVLLDEKDPGQRMAKAEIFRELGKFDDCRKTLQRPFSASWHAKVAALIGALSEKKLRAVREIEVDKLPDKDVRAPATSSTSPAGRP